MTGLPSALRGAPTAARRAAPQARHVERWLACARRAFAELDPDGDGVAQADDIVACLRAKLPPSEARGPSAARRAVSGRRCRRACLLLQLATRAGCAADLPASHSEPGLLERGCARGSTAAGAAPQSLAAAGAPFSPSAMLRGSQDPPPSPPPTQPPSPRAPAGALRQARGSWRQAPAPGPQGSCTRAPGPPRRRRRGRRAAQVDAAFRHAMLEARAGEASARDGLSFEQFMVMLRADSRDSLDQYDDRMGGSSRGGAPGALAGLHDGVGRQPHSPALAGTRGARCSTCGRL